MIGFGAWLFNPRAVRQFRARGYRIVMGLDDDYWSIPDWAPGAGDNGDALGTIEDVLAESDVVVVTTAPLAAEVTSHASPRGVCVIPNALPVDRLPLGRPNLGQKVRIGWAGTSTHGGDWDAIRAPIEAILTRPEVRLVLLTKTPPTWLAAHPRVELHKPVGFDRYYEKLADMRLDIGIAPLAEHPFNHSKSPLKVLDYSALGVPCIASAVGPYAALPDDTPCLRVPNTSDAWGEALAALIEDRERRRAMGRAARQWVETHGSLDVTGPAWAEALGLARPAAHGPSAGDRTNGNGSGLRGPGLPPVVRRWLSGLPPGEAEALPASDLASVPVEPEWIGALILGRLVARGYAAHAPEGFRFRAQRIAAAVADAPEQLATLERRAKFRHRLLGELSRRVAALLEEAEAYVPAACGESEASATPEASRG